MIEFLLTAALALGQADANESHLYLYRTLLVRAAPGDLLEVIDLYKARMPVHDATGDARPFIMRHSQGDQWDLLLLFPMGSFSEYYSAERVDRRSLAAEESGMSEDEFRRALDARVAWREETFVAGPSLDVVRQSFTEADYYHVEMFIALPGKRAALLEQRKMENDYLKRLDRPQNLIFTRVAGAAWDLYTIGFYRDIKHFAESADIPEAREEEAALAAGFEAAGRIGTYLRTLIQSHHDTLARAVR